jgi:hypothetical protein
MGFFGVFIAIVIIALGAGYYSFGVPATSITITNTNSPISESSPSVVSGVAAYQTLKEQATESNRVTEEKAKATMAEGEEAPAVVVPLVVPKEQLAEETARLAITTRLMKSGFAVPAKARTIDTIVLHSSYNPNGDAYSVDEIVKIYEGYGVSAHYLIDRNGTIYQLVEDANIAYHAGVSKMPDGRKNVNDFSIGIEIMNKEETKPTAAQYTAVNALVTSLKKKYPIKSVVGHSDIAPDRKTDPWNFDWKKLKS